MEINFENPPPEETYLGDDPETVEAREAAADKAEERALDQASSARDRELEELRAQLAEVTAEVKRMAAEGHGVERMAASAIEDVRRQQRENLYRALIEAGDKVTIQLHTHEDPARNGKVPVSVNGTTWELARGRPVEVPVCVLAVLDNCRVKNWSPEVDENGEKRMVEHDYLMYPYTMLDPYAAQLMAGLARKVA